MKNIELKVKVPGFGALVSLLRKMKARHTATLHQVDTYYRCRTGRLKTREINGVRFEYIYYRRPNVTHSKVSDYVVIPLSKKQVRLMKRALHKAYGIRLIVIKKRELWMYRHTRIHLDTVKRLGTFLELETVAKSGNLQQFKKEHQRVIECLHLEKYKKVKVSYSDMLARHRR